MNLVIVGSMAFDTIHTPLGSGERLLGGSCTYSSIAASFFTKPGIVGVVGEDFGDENISLLKGKGVDIAGVKREKGKSFFWEGRYHEDMNSRDTIKTELNVFEDFDPLLPENYRAAGCLFLANIDPALQLKVLDRMEASEFTMCDTMNLWIDIKKDELTEVFKRVDCVVLNEEEIIQFTGKNYVSEAAEGIIKLGPEYVIIKKGEKGAVIKGADFDFSLPAYNVDKVIDPTGAGDSFAGAFMGFKAEAGRQDMETMKQALAYGNAVASFAVEGFGMNGLYAASREKINRRVEEIKTSFEEKQNV